MWYYPRSDLQDFFLHKLIFVKSKYLYHRQKRLDVETNIGHQAEDFD